MTVRRQPRRAQILDEAAGLFAVHGFHGVSINDIGAAVGISGPGLYRHFRSKDAMLGEMLIGISERLLSEARRRTSSLSDAGARIDALVDWHVEFALDNPALITIQGRDLSALLPMNRDRVRSLQRQYVDVWAHALQELRPGLALPDARGAAHAAFGLINSTPHIARLDREAVAALLARMARAALRAA